MKMMIKTGKRNPLDFQPGFVKVRDPKSMLTCHSCTKIISINWKPLNVSTYSAVYAVNSVYLMKLANFKKTCKSNVYSILLICLLISFDYNNQY